jgi:hypothetical protein
MEKARCSINVSVNIIKVERACSDKKQCLKDWNILQRIKRAAASLHRQWLKYIVWSPIIVHLLDSKLKKIMKINIYKQYHEKKTVII